MLEIIKSDVNVFVLCMKQKKWEREQKLNFPINTFSHLLKVI